MFQMRFEVGGEFERLLAVFLLFVIIKCKMLYLKSLQMTHAWHCADLMILPFMQQFRLRPYRCCINVLNPSPSAYNILHVR